MKGDQIILNQRQRQRVINEANFLIRTKGTIRQTAKEFNLSKSTIHRDMAVILPLISEYLTTNVCEILKYNYSVKHLRGGETTRERYSKRHLGRTILKCQI